MFAGLNPEFDFQEVIDIMEDRIGFLDIHSFKLDAERGKDYNIAAHWALYCDNYLEGFHIPFVHKDLDAVLDYGNYETIIYDFLNLQIGYASGDEEVLIYHRGIRIMVKM